MKARRLFINRVSFGLNQQKRDLRRGTIQLTLGIEQFLVKLPIGSDIWLKLYGVRRGLNNRKIHQGVDSKGAEEDRFYACLQFRGSGFQKLPDLFGRLAVSKPGCGFSGVTNYFIELFNYFDSERLSFFLFK